MNTMQTFIDETCEQIVRAVAGRSTRRSFLGRASRFVLGILGFELLPALPVNAQPAAATPPWMKCGAYGAMCATDCGQTSDFECPGNCAKGGSWRACCCCPAGSCLYLDYFDCFLVTGNRPNCGNNKTKGANGLKCLGISETQPKPLYRDSQTGNFCCSVVQGTGVPCTP